MSAALDDLCELRPGLKAFAGSLSSPDPLVTEVVLSLARAARDGLPDLYAERAAHLLARHFLDRHAIDAGRSPRSGEIARIGRVEDYLRSHISDPVSLGDLALDRTYRARSYRFAIPQDRENDKHSAVGHVHTPKARWLQRRYDTVKNEHGCTDTA
jgi:hypothetical protein